MQRLSPGIDVVYAQVNPEKRAIEVVTKGGSTLRDYFGEQPWRKFK